MGIAVSNYYSSYAKTNGPWVYYTPVISGGSNTLAVVLIVAGSIAVVGVVAAIVVTKMRKKN